MKARPKIRHGILIDDEIECITKPILFIRPYGLEYGIGRSPRFISLCLYFYVRKYFRNCPKL